MTLNKVMKNAPNMLGEYDFREAHIKKQYVRIVIAEVFK